PGFPMAPVPTHLRRTAAIVAVAALFVSAHAGQLGAGKAAPHGRAAAEDLPRRIISLVPATTEMLFAMGAGDRIAGVSNYDRFPPETARLPKVGGLIDPNVERLISIKP